MESRIARSSREHGGMLLEALATLGIMGAVAVGTVMMSDSYVQDTRTATAAEHMASFAHATNSYVRDNRATIEGLATGSSPVLVSAATLIADQYLPAGFSATNGFQQNLCALVLQPSAGSLNTLVVAEGGEVLDDTALAYFSALMGSGGGGFYAADTTTLRGAGGVWSVPVAEFDNLSNSAGQRCNGTAGAVQLAAGHPVYADWLSAADASSGNFLSREAVPGDPGATTMMTNINMGGNSVSNLAVVNIGDACAAGVANGDLASGPNGEAASCVAGRWSSPGSARWGTDVATFTNLPACTAATMGEMRRTTATSGLYVCNGIRWDAALNEANELVLPAHLRVGGNLAVAGTSAFGNNVDVTGNVKASASVEAPTVKTSSMTTPASTGSLNITTPDGNIVLDAQGTGKVWASGPGGLRVDGELELWKPPYLVVSYLEGGVCAKAGLIGRTTSGTLLQCVSNRWAAMGGAGTYTATSIALPWPGTVTQSTGISMMIIMSDYVPASATFVQLTANVKQRNAATQKIDAWAGSSTISLCQSVENTGFLNITPRCGGSMWVPNAPTLQYGTKGSVGYHDAVFRITGYM